MHAAVTAESSPAWPAPGRAGVRFAVVWAFLRFGGHSSRADFGTVSPERWHRGGSSGEGSGDARASGNIPRRQRHGRFASAWFSASYRAAAILRRDSDPSPLAQGARDDP
jgi:hypothetical protein